MAKKFEEMPPEVQASVLRVLESALTAVNVATVSEAASIVDSVVAAFGRLYPGTQTSIGEIVVNVRVEAESK